MYISHMLENVKGHSRGNPIVLDLLPNILFLQTVKRYIGDCFDFLVAFLI